jgi:hypothetical protein
MSPAGSVDYKVIIIIIIPMEVPIKKGNLRAFKA